MKHFKDTKDIKLNSQYNQIGMSYWHKLNGYLFVTVLCADLKDCQGRKTF